MKTIKHRSAVALYGKRAGSPPAHESILTDREKHVLRAIQRDPEANESLDFLSRKIGCTNEALVMHFVQEAWGPRTVLELGADENMWPELKSFAQKLSALALRMKVLNQLPDWKLTVPHAGLVVKDPDRLRKAFRELPDLLALYASNLKFKSEATEEYGKVSPQPRRKTLELDFANGLARWVRQKTGHSYRDHVVAIQRVTYRRAGRTQLPASGETLRKRDFRWKKRP